MINAIEMQKIVNHMRIQVNENGTLSVGWLSILFVIAMAIQLTDKIDFLHTEMTFFFFALFVVSYIKQWQNKKMSFNKMFVALLLIFFGSTITFYKLIGISDVNWSYIAIYYGWIIYSLLGLFVLDFFSMSQKKFLFYGIYTAVMGNIIYICVYGHSYVNIWKMHVELMANASYSSMIMVFTGVCFMWFLRDDKMLSKVLSSAGVVFSLYANVIILQRGSNFVLTVLMFLFLLLFNSRHKMVVYVAISYLIVVVALFFISELYVPLFNALIDQLDYRLSKKMTEILIFLQSGDIAAANGFSGRTFLAQLSLETWTSSISNFLFGVGDIRSSNTIVGNHGELIDTFARYGIILGMLIFAIPFMQMKEVLSIFEMKKNFILEKQTTVIFFVYIVRNFWGTAFTGAMGIIVIIFLKLMVERCQFINNFQKEAV